MVPDLSIKVEMFRNAVKEREGLKFGRVLHCNSAGSAVVDGTVLAVANIPAGYFPLPSGQGVRRCFLAK